MEMSCIARCVSISKKSKAQGFKTLGVGDIVTFTTPIESVGRNSRGSTYSNRTGEEGYQSFNMLGRLLKNYEFEQLNSEKM
mgnify:CR=1 FL=1